MNEGLKGYDDELAHAEIKAEGDFLEFETGEDLNQYPCDGKTPDKAKKSPAPFTVESNQGEWRIRSCDE